VADVGIPHDIFGEVIWLVVVPQPNSSLSPKALLTLCQNELADYKVPHKVIVRDSLPFTRLGKVDRTSLRKELLK
jgi:acyl-CoA synthetase (AMP-forming)/AMP-acid ligase II